MKWFTPPPRHLENEVRVARVASATERGWECNRVAAALSGSPGYLGFPGQKSVAKLPFTIIPGSSSRSDYIVASLAALTKEQLHPSCCGSHLLGVYLLEHSLMFLFVRTSLGSLLIANRPE